MKVTLKTGQEIEITDEEDIVRSGLQRHFCSCNCPFMKWREFEPVDIMDRSRVIYFCSLIGQTFPYVQGWKNWHFHTVRNKTCMENDSEYDSIPKDKVKDYLDFYNKSERYSIPLDYISVGEGFARDEDKPER